MRLIRKIGSGIKIAGWALAGILTIAVLVGYVVSGIRSASEDSERAKVKQASDQAMLVKVCADEPRPFAEDTVKWGPDGSIVDCSRWGGSPKRALCRV